MLCPSLSNPPISLTHAVRSSNIDEAYSIHLEQLARHVDSGLFQMGGATLREPPAKTDDKLNVSGSAIIARARSAEDVLEVLRQDVYVKEGVWNMDEMQIFPVRC